MRASPNLLALHRTNKNPNYQVFSSGLTFKGVRQRAHPSKKWGKKNVVVRRLYVRFAIVAFEITCRADLCLVGEFLSHPGAGTTNVPALTADETNPSA